MEKNKTVRGSLMFLVAGVGANFLNYLGSLLLARKLPLPEFGEITALFSLVFLLSLPVWAVTAYVSNSVAWKTGPEAEKIGAGAFRESCIIGATIALGGATFAFPLAHLLDSSPVAVALVAFQAGISVPLSAIRGYSQGRKEFASAGAGYFLEASLKVLFLLLLFLPESPTSSMAMASVNAATLATLGILLVPKKFLFSEREKMDRRAFLSTAFGISAILSLTSLDMVAVRSIAPEISGEYALLSRMGQLVFMGNWLFVQIALPHAVSAFRQKKDTKPAVFVAAAAIGCSTAAASALLHFYGTAASDLFFWTSPAEVVAELPRFVFACGGFAFLAFVASFLSGIRAKYANVVAMAAFFSYPAALIWFGTSMSGFVSAAVLSVFCGIIASALPLWILKRSGKSAR